MKRQLIECVPNISEGRDAKKIQEIANVVETVEGVKLLNVDPGQATNRTVTGHRRCIFIDTKGTKPH